MKLKNLTKSVSIIFMLLAMLFSCQPVSENVSGSDSNGNNTTQDGGNNNGGSNQGGNTDNPAVEVTIKFDVNGAGGTVPATITTTSVETVDLPTLTNAKFSHWNTKADGSGLSYKDSATFTESVTLYAILLAVNAHKITYVLDGGVNNPQNSFSFTEDDYIGLKNPTKAGYTFLGWYDNKNFTGEAIKGWAAGDKTADVTLYAKWEKEPEPAVKVTITFNVNKAGGTAPAAIETTSDKSVDLPVLTNAKFSHWNTKADGSGLSYKGSAIFVESVTLYAILLAENAHKITYELNGGVNNSQNKYSFTEDDMVALREPTKDGYKFLGWYETADFSGEAIKVWFEGEKTADVTLYAKWEKEDEVTPGTYTAGTGVYELKAPKDKIGSTFKHWGGFGVLLLKEEQLAAAVNPQEDGTFDNPTAQLTWGWNNLEFPKYASAIGNAEVKSGEKVANSAWATLDEENFTFYVDMSKILCEDSAVEVKVFADGNELMGNAWLKTGRNLDLTGYKPYVIALFDGTSDIVDGETTYAKYLGQCSWGAGIWEMTTSTATKPTSFKTFLDEADVSAIDLTTTKQAGATFQLKDASFANASYLAMAFKNGVATAEFVVEEGEVDTWGRGFFAVWFQFWAGDDNELAKTGKQYFVEGAKNNYSDVFTTLGEPLNLTSDSSRGGNLAVTDLTEAGTYVITVDATGDIPTITVTKK